MSYTNKDGLYVLTGTDQGRINPTGDADVGNIRSLVVKLTVDENGSVTPNGVAGATANDAYIPAHSYILGGMLKVDTAFTSAGAPTLSIGMVQNDFSTVIDADGIDATIALTAIDDQDAVVLVDGALVGMWNTANVATVGGADAYVYTTTATATYTAGEATLTLWYIE